MKRFPLWTLVYNIQPAAGEKWIGEGWEFFDNKEIAERRYAQLHNEGRVPTLRPYFNKTDCEHLHCLQKP